MKILILTSINPVLAESIYGRISYNIRQDNISFLCYPFFAEMKSRLEEGVEFLPAFFAMIRVSIQDKELRKKLYDKKNTIVIGNTYKEEKFDIVVAFDDMNDEFFDTYIEVLKQDEDLKEFKDKLRLDNLYSPEDADLKIYSMNHLITFIKEATKDGYELKQKTNKSR